MKAYETVIGLHVSDAQQELKDMEIKYDSIRVLDEDDVITLEHDGHRLNLVHDKNNFVTKVYFG